MDATTGGRLDLYSYDRPLADCPFLGDWNDAWVFHLFCCDGYLGCSSRGLEIDDDEEPIEGSSVFSD